VRRTSYDFNVDIQNEIYEQRFAEHYLKKYKISRDYFPDWDVKDLLTGKTYEVKRDFWFKHNGNILVEEYFNLEKRIKGWIYHTKADYYVVFFEENEYYIVSMEEVKDKFFNRDKYGIEWQCKDILQKQGFHTRNWVTKLVPNFTFTMHKISKDNKVKCKTVWEWMG